MRNFFKISESGARTGFAFITDEGDGGWSYTNRRSETIEITEKLARQYWAQGYNKLNSREVLDGRVVRVSKAASADAPEFGTFEVDTLEQQADQAELIEA